MDESSKLEPTAPVPVKRRWVSNPKGIPEIYTNYVHPSWSLFDLRFLFGQLKPEQGEGSDFIVEEQAAVTVSWAHAKILADSLNQLISSYESVNGKIVIPNLAPRYDEIV